MEVSRNLHKTYRTEIDGLRALAVLSVVFFHLGFSWAGGGFVGVDVFFVISGYLITRRTFPQMERGVFSYKVFIQGRVRRLFPAVLATVAFSTLAAVLVLPPEPLIDFSKSALSALFAGANIFFWATSGYFDAAAQTKPLLHTWSLGVEEQVYAVYPLLLLWVAKRNLTLRQVLLGYAAAIAAGAGVSDYLLESRPVGAFYLSPLRFYEFAMGAIVFFLERAPAKTKARLPAPIPSLLAASGIGAIVITVFLFDSNTLFPGFRALVPCLGSALFLFFCQPKQWAHRAFSMPAMVWLGKRSYSLYLTHWPWIVFATAVEFDLAPLPNRFALLAVSLATAELLHRFVEERFRYLPKAPSGSRFGLACWGALSALVLVHSIAWSSNGLAIRYPPEFRAALSPDKVPPEKQLWFSGFKDAQFGEGKRILIVGDSQANELIRILVKAGWTEFATFSAAFVRANCGVVHVKPENLDAFFLNNPNIGGNPIKRRGCERGWKSLLTGQQLQEAEHVIVASLWKEYHLPYIAPLLQKLSGNGKRSVHILGRKGFKAGGKAVLDRFVSTRWNRWDTLSVEDLPRFASLYRDEELDEVNKQLKAIATQANVGYIDVMSAACPDKSTCHMLSEDGKVLIRDKSHFTEAGMDYVSLKVLDGLGIR